MRKFIFVLLLVFCAFSAFAEEYRGMYVNSREGLNIRKSPSMSAEKIKALKYGEYIGVVEEGEIVTIDGIKAPWTKILIDYDGNDAAEDYNNYGWVFGGYLQEKCPMTESEIIEYLKRLSKSNEDFLSSEYFPENRVEYMRGKEWECPDFSRALPNYTCNYFDYETHKEVVAIRDCYYYEEPVAAEAYGGLRFVKAGTKLKVSRVADWGIKRLIKKYEEKMTLFPIYQLEDEFGGNAYILGTDVTGSNCVSRAGDGKGGFHTLVYQPVLEDISISNVHNNVESADCSTTHEGLERYFSSEALYEGRWLRGGFETNFAEYSDPKGEKYPFDINSRAGRLKLLYPLNMENPMPILQEDSFKGGMGGGYYQSILKTISKTMAHTGYLDYVCSYGYTSADAGFEGMAYHYFTRNGFVVYEYQTDEMGKVKLNRQEAYQREGTFPYKFSHEDVELCEPQGKSQSLKVGQYVNPICRLKMRQSPDRYSRTLLILKPGTLLKVVEVGERETIDGLSANWVKVEPVNDEKSVEGYVIKNWLPAEATAAWVFGAYLE